ncbi:MAG: HEAT repeat domain-containing protein [Planctomycetes bacterium]|nr:HEAT repeat domain-containing protein [Planctomycetota bacterium]
MDKSLTDRCPQCSCLFIGPKPDFCPSCHSCLHWSTAGTDSEAITVTVKTAVTSRPEPSGSPKTVCTVCRALVLGPPPAACPSCGAPLAPVPEDLPRILAGEDTAAAGPRVAVRPRPASAAPAREAAPSGIPPARDRAGDARRRVRDALEAAGSLRWVFLSAGFHALLLLALWQIAFATLPDRGEKSFRVGFGKFDVPSPKPGEGKDVVEESPGKEIKEPGAPAKAEETPAEASPSPPPNPEEPPASGFETGTKEATETPQGFGPGTPTKGGGADGTGGDFGNRTGEGRGEALRRYGGSLGSEAAVARGLSWLARHQAPDGSWSGARFDLQCPDEPCDGTGMDGYTTGHTGLALLCFLGAGFTHREGTHEAAVRNGLAWLVAAQGADGRFGPASGCYLYNHAIACLALAEAFGLTHDPKLRGPLERGVAWLLGAQQRCGGWDYGHMPSKRGDTSVTGFAVMALKSAHGAGVRVPPENWRRARDFVRGQTLEDGRVEYEDNGHGARRRMNRYGPGMSAVGLLCHLYFGEKADSPTVRGVVGQIRANPPSFEGLRHDQMHTAYYWYYATLALFQLGGEPWTWWNERYRDFAVGLQRRDGCAEGSWDPEDGWLAPYGGRLYMTTMNLLSLEVYYRYLPLYQGGSTPSLANPRPAGSPEEAEENLRIALDPRESSGRRLRAIQALEKVAGVEARGACMKALEDPNAVVRWQAAKTLGARREKEAVEALRAALGRGDPAIVASLLEALGRIGGREALLAVAPFAGHGDAPVRAAALKALRGATGEDHGADPAKWTRFLATFGD